MQSEKRTRPGAIRVRAGASRPRQGRFPRARQSAGRGSENRKDNADKNLTGALESPHRFCYPSTKAKSNGRRSRHQQSHMAVNLLDFLDLFNLLDLLKCPASLSSPIPIMNSASKRSVFPL